VHERILCDIPYSVYVQCVCGSCDLYGDGLG
jgi:hypothetical protein